MSYERPYEGIKVVDLSQGIAGPYCGMLLAQYGADVVKVEPLEGDWSRILGTVYGDNTAYSIAGNLGKRSIALDLKTEAGREIVNRLIDGADLFMEGFRPGVIQRLGFGYEDVAKRNPGIVYLSVSGFSQKGPLATKPAMDPVLQAFSGFMMENKGQDGIPHRTNPIVVDMSTALYCFQAVSAALYAKRDATEGRFIDASLMAAASNLQVVRMMATYLEKGEIKAPSGPSGTFPTADGYIQIVILRDRDYLALCDALGLPDLAADPRFQTRADRVENADYLGRAISAVLSQRTTAEWTAILTEAKLQNEAVLDYFQFLDHPHVEASGLVSWLNHSAVPEPIPVPNPPGTVPLVDGMAAAHAPHLGEHTGQVLAELGIAAEQAEQWRAAGAIKG
ncbi:MAG: CoA transferase [Alphaproteobacteria bacterium]|nr:CoA transferase [Alphaproteobacteria bacterium]MCB9928508.1 CoA transferase [Alphaproteobacteria bacterium]